VYNFDYQQILSLTGDIHMAHFLNFDTFGKRCKALRISNNLSQTDLRCEMQTQCAVSVGETYISQLEGSDRMPSLEVAAAMATVFGVSLDYLGLLIDEPHPIERSALTIAAPSLALA
jgi:transcriptional regulator with XRE-family HTH domain